VNNEILIKELNEKFIRGHVIPFIGAGLSMPFSVPDWGKLIRGCALKFGIEDVDGASFLPMLDFNLEKYNYWEAVSIIKKYLLRNEEDIQQYVQEIVVKSIPKDISGIDNNYVDLAISNFNIYFTTNYDHIIQNYIRPDCIPVNLKDVNDNLQTIINSTEGKRVFHLHGNVTDASSIVLSKYTYDKLYGLDVYKMMFSLFAGVKTFLFLGFSFDDIFIREIIKDNREYFKSKHYIILANPDAKKIEMLKREYNIETISYDPTKTTHVQEIRNILNLISKPRDENVEITLESEEYMIKNTTLDKLPNQIEKQRMENNLFCRKLRAEYIRESKVDMSKECFFTAEQYFRWLKKSGISASDDIAKYMLSLAYMKYKEGLITVFEEERDAEKFWNNVHEELKTIDFNKLKNRINEENMPNEINRQGFIHILADEADMEQEIWWGDKRFE